MIEVSPVAQARISEASGAFRAAGLSRELAGVLAALMVQGEACTQFIMERLADLQQPAVSKGTSEGVERGYIRATWEKTEARKGHIIYSLAKPASEILESLEALNQAEQRTTVQLAAEARRQRASA